MKRATYTFTSPLRLYHSAGATWQYVLVPKAESTEIRAKYISLRAGFGSIKVTVTVGATTWQTSLFPDSKAGTYILFIKKAVRQKEGIEVGDECSYQIRVTTG